MLLFYLKTRVSRKVRWPTLILIMRITTGSRKLLWVNFFMTVKKDGGAHELGHSLPGHLKVKNVPTLQSSVISMNLNQIHFLTSSLICNQCIENKQHMAAFPNKNGHQTNRPLKIAYLDLFGHMRDVKIV
jgi:hypothetical protein